MRLSGSGGRLQSGPRTVGRIGSWTLHRVDAAPKFEAELAVTVTDTFWWGQTGIELVLEQGRRTWTWHIDTLPAYAPSVMVSLDGAPVIS